MLVVFWRDNVSSPFQLKENPVLEIRIFSVQAPDLFCYAQDYLKAYSSVRTLSLFIQRRKVKIIPIVVWSEQFSR